MDESMIKKLDRFFAEKTITDVNRDRFLVCGLEDKRYRLDIALFFMSDWHSDYNSYEEIDIQGKGAIFIFPQYWVSVPKPLVMEYLTYILNDFYNTKVVEWGLGYTGNTNTSDPGCPNYCPC